MSQKKKNKKVIVKRDYLYSIDDIVFSFKKGEAWGIAKVGDPGKKTIDKNLFKELKEKTVF